MYAILTDGGVEEVPFVEVDIGRGCDADRMV